MDSAEETLRQKLLVLEKDVLDPALNGRSEEIWARMVSVRERGRQLQREFERAGKGLQEEKEGMLDEEVMKRVKKVRRCIFRYICDNADIFSRSWKTIAPNLCI